MTSNLILAIEAATEYASHEKFVVIASARSVDITDSWFIIEGVRAAYHRLYVVHISKSTLSSSGFSETSTTNRVCEPFGFTGTDGELVAYAQKFFKDN